MNNMEDKKRRKCKGGNEASSSKKKKDREPQRGMGVATLERLRVQENLKQMSQITNLPFNVLMKSAMNNQEQQQHHGLMMNSSVVLPGVHFSPAFGGYEGVNGNKVGVGHFCGDQGLFVQRVGGFDGLSSGKNCVGFSGVGLSLGCSNVKYEASNQLSPTTPPASNFSDYADKCGFCHKKKRVDGKSANQSHQVEVVAVHPKGGQCGRGVMMEYEFFPEKGVGVGGGNRNSPESSVALELLMSGGGAVGGYNCVSTTTSTSNRSTGGGGVENSSSIDLSLKLYH